MDSLKAGFQKATKGGASIEKKGWNTAHAVGWAVGFVVLGVATLVALIQKSPSSYGLKPRPPVLSWAFWLSPIERNAFFFYSGADLHGVFALKGSGRVWVVGKSGTIIQSGDDGRTWDVQQTNRFGDLDFVRFTDERHGWIEGAKVLRTENGGKTWWDDSALRGTNGESPWSLSFVSPQYGWALGPNISLSGDRRISSVGPNVMGIDSAVGSWVPYSPLIDPFAQSLVRQGDPQFGSLWFTSTNQGWVAGQLGTIWTTEDGGRGWKPQSSGTTLDLTFVQFVDSATGWIGDLSGTVLGTTNCGGTWQKLTNLNCRLGKGNIHFASRSIGWLIASNRTILRTTDGGSHWEKQFDSPSTDLIGLHFADTTNGYVVGSGGTVLRTRNGGKNWVNPVLEARALPARWFHTLGVGLLGYTGLLLWRFRPKSGVTESIVDSWLKDAPIENSQSDRLDFTPVARGLSRFFRNPKTDPPLTVAITGEWGTGKSSLMKLLQADLLKHGIRPVWFNVWHHQQDEQIFASLMGSVINQAVPDWWNPLAWMFRARLLWQRAKRHWLTTSLLLAFVGIGIGMCTRPNRESAEETINRFQRNMAAAVQAAKGFLTERAPASAPNAVPATTATANVNAWEASKGIGVLVSLLALARALWTALKAFDVKPSTLLAKATGGTKVSTLDAKASFQMRFASEFKDVTEALGERQMVIFIDDLDRCQPSKVLQMLEAINFLVSNGKCFVVLSLAKPQVEAALGLGFERIASEVELSAEEQADARCDGTVAHKKRSAFARLYLKKLINIEIRVPKANADHMLDLINSGAKREQRPEDQLAWISIPATVHRLKPAIPMLFFLALFVLAFVVGHATKLSMPQPGTPTNPLATARPGSHMTAQTSQVIGPAAVQAGGQTNLADVLRFKVALPTGSGGGESTWGVMNPKWWWWLLLPGMVGLGLWRAASWREAIEVRDSAAFTDAVRIWFPVVHGSYLTPRELKRYLNRVRYMAMRQRAGEPTISLFSFLAIQFRHWFRRGAPVSSPSPARPASAVSEADLVMLTALEAYEATRRSGNMSQGQLADITNWKRQHKEVFHMLPDESARDAYKRLASEIAIN